MTITSIPKDKPEDGSAALKPCPFCGNTRPFWDYSGPTYWQVCCNEWGCQASTLLADSEAEAIARWNRRPSQPEEGE